MTAANDARLPEDRHIPDRDELWVRNQLAQSVLAHRPEAVNEVLLILQGRQDQA